MYELDLTKATVKKVKDHQYYVFPKPPVHTNQENRPSVYADEGVLQFYSGKGRNGAAKLHPDVLTPAGKLLSAMVEYVESIDDLSLRSAVIQNGYRPDDASQGANYLRIIKQSIATHQAIFGTLKFPESLNEA